MKLTAIASWGLCFGLIAGCDSAGLMQPASMAGTTASAGTASPADSSAGQSAGAASGRGGVGGGSAGSAAGSGGALTAGVSGAAGGGGASGAAGTAVAGSSGAAGDAGTGSATGGGPVELPDGVTGLFPLPGAEGLCPDPPLRLSFSGPPSLGSSGRIRVFDRAASAAAVATIDLGAMSVSEMRGGQTFGLPRPVYVEGNDVIAYTQPHALEYGKRYYVTVEQGAIRGPANAAFAISDPEEWTFTTRAAAPANASTLGVGLDGASDFCSLQGAIDAVPSGNRDAITLAIGAGTYHGVVYFSGKHNLTLRGADRKRVVIAGVNNNELNPGTRIRALFGADDANGLTIENLTIHNLTPQGGSQAEALRLQDCERCAVRAADILSLQDTLLWSGRIYAHNCYIEGNVDFVWGTGVAYFEECEIKTVGRSGPIVQARNAAGAYGYVFVNSRITSDPGLTGSTLGRIDASVYPGSQVAYVDCTLGSHISRAGWQITGGTPSSSLRFWEYGSKDAGGNPIDVSGRLSGSTQISAAQAATLRDKAAVLGGWTPE